MSLMRFYAGIAATAVMGISTSAVSEPLRCEQVAGLGALVADHQSMRYLIVGEVHGTREIPELFGDLACSISEQRPVTLALELPVQIQGDIDTYLASDGSDDDRASLLASRFWGLQIADGRSSGAMLALLDEARQLRAAGRNVEVKASRASAGALGMDSSELLTAAEWVKAGAEHPTGLVLVLVGRAHATKTPTERLRSAASLLPARDTISLAMVSRGGRFWGCYGDNCGEHDLQDQPDERTVGIHMGMAPDGFDGALAVGRLTPSTPAVTTLR